MCQALPIYELVRFSTAATQAHTRLPLLKQAWEEYMQQFNPCRCAPCRNNGVPVLTRTACSCLCKTGYEGLACEKATRQREFISRNSISVRSQFLMIHFSVKENELLSIHQLITAIIIHK